VPPPAWPKIGLRGRRAASATGGQCDGRPVRRAASAMGGQCDGRPVPTGGLSGPRTPGASLAQGTDGIRAWAHDGQEPARHCAVGLSARCGAPRPRHRPPQRRTGGAPRSPAHRGSAGTLSPGRRDASLSAGWRGPYCHRGKRLSRGRIDDAAHRLFSRPPEPDRLRFAVGSARIGKTTSITRG
jgi:hypothetical protein